MKTIYAPDEPKSAIQDLQDRQWTDEDIPQITTLKQVINNPRAGFTYMVSFSGNKPVGLTQIVYVETLPDGWFLMTTTSEETSNYDLKMSPDCIVAFFARA